MKQRQKTRVTQKGKHMITLKCVNHDEDNHEMKLRAQSKDWILVGIYGSETEADMLLPAHEAARLRDWLVEYVLNSSATIKTESDYSW